MTFSSQTAPIHVIPVGAVAGLAWASGPPGASDLTVVGKMVFMLLDRDALARSVTPEQPGWHLGNPAPEEVDPRGGRRVVVRGERAFPGHLAVRRGDEDVLEVLIPPGAAQVAEEAPRSAKATSTSDIGDWFIVSGCDDPHGRRWCNVPSVGLVASWSGAEPMALLCRVCAVCVKSSTVALLFRGSKHLTTQAPQSLQLSIVPMSDDTASKTASGSSSKPTITAELDHHRLAVRKALPFSAAPGAPVIAPVPLVPRVPTGTAEVSTPRDRDEIRKVLAQSAPAAPSPLREDFERRVRDGGDLTGVDVRNGALRGAELRNAKLGGLDFSGADLTNADLTGADLTGAKLEQAQLNGAKLDGAILLRAKLDRASFKGASMRQVQARECEGTAVMFEDADLEEADLRGGKLPGAKMARAKAQAMNGQGADLSGADLSNARFERATLRNAVLRGATLHRGRFSNADLRDADLREAEPESALQGAKLAGSRR